MRRFIAETEQNKNPHKLYAQTAETDQKKSSHVVWRAARLVEDAESARVKSYSHKPWSNMFSESGRLESASRIARFQSALEAEAFSNCQAGTQRLISRSGRENPEFYLSGSFPNAPTKWHHAISKFWLRDGQSCIPRLACKPFATFQGTERVGPEGARFEAKLPRSRLLEQELACLFAC